MAVESFLIGVALGAPIVVGIVAFTAILDFRFSRRVKPGGDRAWVRGDASFQGWIKQYAGVKVGYARRMLFVVGADRIELYVPHRVQPVWSIGLQSIEAVSVESFRSRTVRGLGVRIRVKGGSTFVVRPEILWLPATFSPRSLANELAHVIATATKSAKEEAG